MDHHEAAATAAVEFFDRGQYGKIWRLCLGSPDFPYDREGLEEAFLRVFAGEALRSAGEGDFERATRLFRCACDHALTNRAWWQIRDAWVRMGLDPDLLQPQYQFPFPAYTQAVA